MSGALLASTLSTSIPTGPILALIANETKSKARAGSHPQRSWLDDLDEEVHAFLKRLVLASGSLEELGRVRAMDS
jgi:hypothetical protein